MYYLLDSRWSTDWMHQDDLYHWKSTGSTYNPIILSLLLLLLLPGNSYLLLHSFLSLRSLITEIYSRAGLPWWLAGKKAGCSAGDIGNVGSIHGLGRSPGGRKCQRHSSILAWKIPWREDLGGLLSKGLQRVGHDWATKHSLQGEVLWTDLYHKMAWAKYGLSYVKEAMLGSFLKGSPTYLFTIICMPKRHFRVQPTVLPCKR